MITSVFNHKRMIRVNFASNNRLFLIQIDEASTNPERLTAWIERNLNYASLKYKIIKRTR
jgi:hypothetical protein